VRLVKSSLVVTVLVGACLVSPGSLAQADHLPAARDLNVRLKPDGAQARDSVRAGRYRIEVRTPRRAFGVLTLLKPDRGFTRADLRHGRGNVGKNLRSFGGLTLHPGQTGVMWETLYAGRYWLMSETFGPRPSRERIRTIRVHGTPSPSRFPRVSAEAFNRDNGARITARIPRAGRMLIRNTSPRLDAIVLLPLKDGFTYREFLAWLRRDGEGKSPLRLGFRITGYTSPGVGYVLRYRLRPGNWVVTDPFTLFGFGRQHRLTQAFRPLRVHGGKTRAAAAAGAARYAADGFTSSPRQRRTVGRALQRIAEGQSLPQGRTPWQLLTP
jgi:hypothetical protein